MRDGERTYLGDGAYVESRDYDVRVFTSNGVTETGGVYLGPNELRRLVEFAQGVGLIPGTSCCASCDGHACEEQP